MEPPNPAPIPPTLERVLVNPGQPPKPAHQFLYTVLGDSIQLDVGYIDIRETREAIEKSKEGLHQKMYYYVTDRFVLTPDMALGLLQTANELVKTLRDFGKLPRIEDASVGQAGSS